MSEQEELLLQQYFDGEAGFFGKRKARSILRRSAEAREFISKVDTVANTLRFAAEEDQMSISVLDLEERIHQRLIEERRAEKFLGKRVEEKKTEKQSWSPFIPFASGALAATCALLVFQVFPVGQQGEVRSGTIAKNVSTVQSLQEPVRQVIPVKLETPERNPKTFTPAPAGEVIQVARRPVEVDWVRSDGRVRMIQSRTQAPIFWVSRRSRTLYPETGNPDFRILEPRVPTAITVGAERSR